MQELGELLIRLRGRLSLREAARKSGLSYSYISSLEKGKHPRTGAQINPTPDSLRNLARAYDYPYDELMKLAGYSEGNHEKYSTEELDEEKKQLANIIVNIKDPEKKKQAIAYLEYLASSSTDGAKK